MFKKFFKKLFALPTSNIQEVDIIEACLLFDVNPTYLQSEFILDESIHSPSFIVRFDVIED